MNEERVKIGLSQKAARSFAEGTHELADELEVSAACATVLASLGTFSAPTHTYSWAEALAKANPDVSVRRAGWLSPCWHVRWCLDVWQGRNNVGDTWEPYTISSECRRATDWEVYEEDSDQLTAASDLSAESGPTGGEPELTRAAMVRDFGEPNINVKLFGEGYGSVYAGRGRPRFEHLVDYPALHYPPGVVVRVPGKGAFVLCSDGKGVHRGGYVGGVALVDVYTIGLVECWHYLEEYGSKASLYRYIRLVPEWEIPAARDKLGAGLRKNLAEFRDSFTPDQQEVLFEPELGSRRWAKEMCWNAWDVAGFVNEYRCLGHLNRVSPRTHALNTG